MYSFEIRLKFLVMAASGKQRFLIDSNASIVYTFKPNKC